MLAVEPWFVAAGSIAALIVAAEVARRAGAAWPSQDHCRSRVEQ
jgi:hypothetical protein